MSESHVCFGSKADPALRPLFVCLVPPADIVSDSGASPISWLSLRWKVTDLMRPEGVPWGLTFLTWRLQGVDTPLHARRSAVKWAFFMATKAALVSAKDSRLRPIALCVASLERRI